MTIRYITALLLIIGFATSVVQGQNNYQRLADISKKKDQKLLTQARQYINLQQYDDAVSVLSQLIERNPSNIDLLYMRGTIYRDQKRYPAAINDLKQGLSLSERYNYGVFLELGRIYQLSGDLTQAIKSYKDFLSKVNPSDRNFKKAERLLENAKTSASLMENPLPFEAQPLAGAINTKEHLEYFPNLSVDGKRMIFVRRLNGNEEDFFESYRQEDNSWAEARPLDYVNSEFNEGAQTVSADGKLIIYTICGKPGTFGSCDLYYTELKNGRWTKVANMGPNINGRWKDTQPSLSADGRLLLFASTRPGGIGGEFDIYGSSRDENGQWSKAVNMGPTINTTGADLYPFLHSDGRTLYFTSDGHPGMGGQDLFFVQLQDDNTWTNPKNLGYPINTAAEEANIFISMDGEEMFFAKQSSGDNKDIDIYTAKVPEQVKPIPSTYVKAKVIDAKSRATLVANVRLRAVGALIAPKTYTADKEEGFITVLSTGKNYAFSVDKSGYFPYSQQFNLDGKLAPEEPYDLTIELQPIEEESLPKNKEIVLRHVLFDSGSAALLPASYTELDRLYDLMNRLPDIKVEIGGHTDNVGSKLSNQQLSEQRAKAVSDYLMSKGIPQTRLSHKGYGEQQPIADNSNSAGRSENRRTSFTIL